jgi:nitrile hydratase accessory protein
MAAERKPDLDGLTGALAIPRKNGELVFAAPWQARAFGMAVGLHQEGLFEWEDFRSRLIAEVGDTHPEDAGADASSLYYRQWLRALERLLVDKGVLSAGDLHDRAAEFASGKRDEVF